MKNIKTILKRSWGIFLFCLGIVSLSFSVQAEVFEVKLDPHRWIGEPFWHTYVDLNMDGNMDCVLEANRIGSNCYLNPSTMVVENKNILNPKISFTVNTAVLPFGTVIGKELSIPGQTEKESPYVWSKGDEIPEAYYYMLGRHPDWRIAGILAPDLDLSGRYYGDWPYKEGVMGIKFKLEGKNHYGYLHFDHHLGFGGYLLGWAYETEPEKPIVAKPLGVNPSCRIGILTDNWGKTSLYMILSPGRTYQLQKAYPLSEGFKPYPVAPFGDEISVAPDDSISDSLHQIGLEIDITEEYQTEKAALWRMVRLK